jgi:hypothetical protein
MIVTAIRKCNNLWSAISRNMTFALSGRQDLAHQAILDEPHLIILDLQLGWVDSMFCARSERGRRFPSSSPPLHGAGHASPHTSPLKVNGGIPPGSSRAAARESVSEMAGMAG